MDTGWNYRLQLAQEVVDGLLRSLPPRLRSETESIPVTFEPSPSVDQIADGIEPDTLGLFVGEAFPELHADGPALPSQVVLYLDNIWDFVEGNKEAYQDEIRTTLLHELGHFLGLDESDLEARGLE